MNPPALLGGLVAGATVIVVGIEALSLLNGIQAWLLIPLTLAGVMAVWVSSRRHVESVAWLDDDPTDGGGPRSPPVRVVGAILVLLGVTTLVTALAAPPNTWDSMTYHLPRIAHWLDRGTLGFSQTPIDRELWQPPFAEYLGLAVYGSLGGRDVLSNLPQWIAGVGVAIAAAGIAGELGARPWGRLMAALLAATVPAAILQSSSTQTDLLAALWVATVAFFALTQWNRPKPTWRTTLLFGAALGLAVGTKGTAFPLVVPWLVLFVVGQARLTSPRTVAGRTAALIAVAAALNLPHWLRNQEAFGTPLGPASLQTLVRPESFSPAVIGSNLVTNLSLHAGTPSDDLNHGIETAVVGLHGPFGLDVAALYPYFGGFRIVPWSTHEDLAGAPLHVALAMLGLGYGLWAWKRVGRSPRAAMVALVASVLLLAGTVRWQPYNGRLHLPLLALAAPLTAVFLTRAGPRIGGLVIAGLTLGALFPALGNQTRPLLPALARGDPIPRTSILAASRGSIRFNARPELESAYAEMTAAIARSGCTRVGLLAGYDSWEYPLWAGTDRVAFEHVDPTAPVTPVDAWCAIVALDGPADFRGPTGYVLRHRAGAMSLWQRPSTPSGLQP